LHDKITAGEQGGHHKQTRPNQATDANAVATAAITAAAAEFAIFQTHGAMLARWSEGQTKEGAYAPSVNRFYACCSS